MTATNRVHLATEWIIQNKVSSGAMSEETQTLNHYVINYVLFIMLPLASKVGIPRVSLVWLCVHNTSLYDRYSIFSSHFSIESLLSPISILPVQTMKIICVDHWQTQKVGSLNN